MSIRKRFGLYCTSCSCQSPFEEETESDTRKHSAEHGWSRRRVPNGSIWDICPGCLPAFSIMPEVAHDFVDVSIENLQEMIAAEIKRIHAQRAEILVAFIAKHKCEPDDCVMVEQEILGMRKFFVRQRTLEEREMISRISSEL